MMLALRHDIGVLGFGTGMKYRHESTVLNQLATGVCRCSRQFGLKEAVHLL